MEWTEVLVYDFGVYDVSAQSEDNPYKMLSIPIQSLSEELQSTLYIRTQPNFHKLYIDVVLNQKKVNTETTKF